MRMQGIVATTKLVKRGDDYIQIPVEVLENISMSGVPVTPGHNPSLLPLGKIERAWVEKHSATEASLHQSMYLVTEEPELFIHKVSETSCVHIPFADSPGKFAVNASGQGPRVTVDISAVPAGRHKRLTEEIHSYNKRITVGSHDNREEIPIPLIKFVSDMSLAETLVTALKIAMLGAAVTGRLSKWVEDTVKWIKNECIPILKTIRRHKTKASISIDDEWIVLEFDARNVDGPLIELVIPSKHDSEIPESAAEKFAEQIELFCDLLPDCDKVVFVFRSGEDKCEFRYALTKKGGVIGAEACYEESIVPYKKWLGTEEERTTVYWTLVTQDDGELTMQLFLLGGDHPKFLGLLSMDSSYASKILEFFDADDGILRPLH